MRTGYGLGALGQGASYYFISSYFVVFLTNCVGFSSSTAGTISSLAMVVEVIAGMVVGNFSDRCTSKMGRRRPFMMAAALAMMPVCVLLFRYIQMPAGLRIAYYLILAVAFRIAFSTNEIPYNALGAEIVTGYESRIRLRSITRAFSIAGNAIGYIMPLMVLDMFTDQRMAWQVMGLIIGACCLIGWMTCVAATGKNIYVLEKAEKKENLVKEILISYRQLLALRPMKLAVVYKIAFTCAFSLYSVGTIYFLQYNLGLDNRYTSYIYIFTVAIFALATPLTDKMAMAKSKAWQQMVVMASCAVAGIAIYLFASDSVMGCAVYIGIFAMVQTGFWQLSSSIFYDIVEVDEYVNHKRREGDIMSAVSVLGTLITAIMVQAFGIFFDLAGFDPDLQVQPESVTGFLNIAYILFPCICLLVGAAVLKIFPINKETFASLQTALSLRKKGERYDQYMADIERIIGTKAG